MTNHIVYQSGGYPNIQEISTFSEPLEEDIGEKVRQIDETLAVLVAENLASYDV